MSSGIAWRRDGKGCAVEPLAASGTCHAPCQNSAIMATVTVFVHSLDTRSERRFDLAAPLHKIKVRSIARLDYSTLSGCAADRVALAAQERIEIITGIPSSSQQIGLYRTEEDTQPLCILDNDERPLGFYGVVDWQVLKVGFSDNLMTEDTDCCHRGRARDRAKVEDLQPSLSFTGQLTDVSQVDKFELTEQQYAERRGA